MLAPDVALAELTDRTAWVAELMLVMVQAAPVVLPRWEYAPPPAQDTRTDLPMSAVVNWACAGAPRCRGQAGVLPSRTICAPPHGQAHPAYIGEPGGRHRPHPARHHPWLPPRRVPQKAGPSWPLTHNQEPRRARRRRASQ